MHRAITIIVLLFIAALVGSAQSDSSDSNLCFHEMAGTCSTDTEWSIGWFWGTYGVSQASCNQYNQIYGSTVGDIWSLCAQFDSEGSQGTTDDYANAELAFTLTSRWHALPASGVEPCPFEGLDPIINYEENTFVCATDF